MEANTQDPLPEDMDHVGIDIGRHGDGGQSVHVWPKRWRVTAEPDPAVTAIRRAAELLRQLR
jgi:hypothetical protein